MKKNRGSRHFTSRATPDASAAPAAAPAATAAVAAPAAAAGAAVATGVLLSPFRHVKWT